MKEQILQLLNTLPEKQQNEVIQEVRNAIRENRMKQAATLELEARRIKDTLNQI